MRIYVFLCNSSGHFDHSAYGSKEELMGAREMVERTEHHLGLISSIIPSICCNQPHKKMQRFRRTATVDGCQEVQNAPLAMGVGAYRDAVSYTHLTLPTNREV